MTICFHPPTWIPLPDSLTGDPTTMPPIFLMMLSEIRPVTRTEQRIAEAEKLGFARIFIPKGTKGTGATKGIELVQVGMVNEVLGQLFG